MFANHKKVAKLYVLRFCWVMDFREMSKMAKCLTQNVHLLPRTCFGNIFTFVFLRSGDMMRLCLITEAAKVEEPHNFTTF